MTIYILDSNLDIIGPVPVFTSLIWDRRYYEPGVFEFHSVPEYFNIMRAGKYLYRSDRPTELGVIRNQHFDNSSCYCKGFLAESLLDNRVIDKTCHLSGTPETIGRTLVTDYFISPTDSSRGVNNILLGTVHNIGSEVSIQVTGDNVGAFMYEVEKTQEMSHRLLYNYQTNKFTLDFYKGLDRTDQQNVNSWAVFSDTFQNVKTFSYDLDSSDYRNFAYIAGEGEGSDRKVTYVDICESATEERRELYVDARDLQQTTETGHTYTDEKYESLLQQRGRRKLAEYNQRQKVESDVDPDANLVYGVDFDLGDICTVMKSSIGIAVDTRITEIRETIEGASRTVDVIFGEDSPTNIRKIIRRETT